MLRKYYTHYCKLSRIKDMIFYKIFLIRDSRLFLLSSDKGDGLNMVEYDKNYLYNSAYHYFSYCSTSCIIFKNIFKVYYYITNFKNVQ